MAIDCCSSHVRTQAHTASDLIIIVVFVHIISSFLEQVEHRSQICGLHIPCIAGEVIFMLARVKRLYFK